MIEVSLTQKLVAWVLPVLFAITVHEVAHGWVAARLGDKTAMMLGRLTLNPVRHIDPVGTILIPGLLLLLHAGFIFGWAKPVPITWQNLRHPKRDMALVAVAGPVVNLLMAALWALVIRIGLTGGESWFALPMVFMGVAGIFINTILMVLNLLPLPPLDGGRVVTGLLPGPWAWRFSQIEPYGIWILVALLATGVLGMLMWPMISHVLGALAAVSGLSERVFEQILFALMGR
jgi:Zn-dependent protease